MKRKEKEQFWLEKIYEYREIGKSLVQWCTDKGVAIHNMNYWLRKQAPIILIAKWQKQRMNIGLVPTFCNVNLDKVSLAKCY